MLKAVASSMVAKIPAAVGRVTDTSPAKAGAINFTLEAPSLLSSKNDTNPPEVLPFLTDRPAFAIGTAANVATPVCVSVPAMVRLRIPV